VLIAIVSRGCSFRRLRHRGANYPPELKMLVPTLCQFFAGDSLPRFGPFPGVFVADRELLPGTRDSLTAVSPLPSDLPRNGCLTPFSAARDGVRKLRHRLALRSSLRIAADSRLTRRLAYLLTGLPTVVYPPPQHYLLRGDRCPSLIRNRRDT